MYPMGDKMLKPRTITWACSCSKYVSDFQGNSV